MLNHFLINDNYVVALGLVLLRITAFMFSSAILSSPNVTVPIKILLSLLLSLSVFPSQLNLVKSFPHLSEQVISLSVQALMVGLIMGMVTRFFFYTIGMAGDLISTSIGLNSAQVYNPLSNTQSNILEQFQILLGTLVFLALQGHHVMIDGLVRSFQHFPIVGKTLQYSFMTEAVRLGGLLMQIAIQMAAPVVATIFLINVTMGILGRAVPQLNVMVTSFSLTLMAGTLVIYLTMPLMIGEMGVVLEKMGYFMSQMMRNL